MDNHFRKIRVTWKEFGNISKGIVLITIFSFLMGIYLSTLFLFKDVQALSFIFLISSFMGLVLGFVLAFSYHIYRYDDSRYDFVHNRLDFFNDRIEKLEEVKKGEEK